MLVPDPVAIGGVRVKLLDFGIAKIKDSNDSNAMSMNTRTGTLVGTPTYMSPEQCRSQPQIDGQSDVYSLGVIFYELLAGRPPFRSEALGEMMALHLFAPPRPLQHLLPQIPPELEAFVLRMLAKKPEDRPTAVEVVNELSRLKVQDEDLLREEDSEDHTQAALSQDQISDLAQRAALMQDERSLSMQGVHATPTPGGTPNPTRKRRLGLLQLGIGAGLLLLGGAYLVSRFEPGLSWRSGSVPRGDGTMPAGSPQAGPHDGPSAAGVDGSAQDAGVDASAVSARPTPAVDDPELAELRQQLSEVKGSKALRLIKRALKRHPDRAALQELACEYFLKAGKYSDAKKSCERALAQEPSRGKARALLLEVKQAREEDDEPEAPKADKEEATETAGKGTEPAAAPAPSPAAGPKKSDAYNVDFLR